MIIVLWAFIVTPVAFQNLSYKPTTCHILSKGNNFLHKVVILSKRRNNIDCKWSYFTVICFKWLGLYVLFCGYVEVLRHNIPSEKSQSTSYWGLHCGLSVELAHLLPRIALHQVSPNSKALIAPRAHNIFCDSNNTLVGSKVLFPCSGPKEVCGLEASLSGCQGSSPRGELYLYRP